jgi:hypothetical protein
MPSRYLPELMLAGSCADIRSFDQSRTLNLMGAGMEPPLSLSLIVFMSLTTSFGKNRPGFWAAAHS